MELFYRAMYPRPVVLVSCVEPKTGKPNIIPVAWSTPLSFKPPLIGVSIAPQRYSHKLIAEAGEFVVNIPNIDLLNQTDLCGSTSGRDVDKFQLSGFTPKPSRLLKTPVIEECAAHLECILKESFTIGDHTLFVGEVKAAYCDEGFLKGGLVDLEHNNPLHQLGRDNYTTPDKRILKPGKN